MANAAILYDDKVPAAVLSGSTTPATLPLANLQDEQPKKLARLLGAAGFVIADFGAATAIRAVALGSTNLTTAATWRIRLGPREAVVEEAREIDFDFSASASLTQNGKTLAWTRASTATYFDAAGVERVAASGEARDDYDPVSHAWRGKLVEPQATNQRTYSEDFTDASWTKDAGTTVDANQAIGLDSANTAQRYNFTNTGGAIRKATSVANDSAARCVSWRVKRDPASVSSVITRLRLVGGSAIVQDVTYNLAAGTCAAGPAAGATLFGMDDLGNGYWRIWQVIANNSSGNTTFDTQIYAAATGWWYLDGMQAEDGTVPTSYIPTTSATVTRAADVPGIAALGAAWNAGEGTLAVEAMKQNNGTDTFFAAFSDGSNNNVVMLESYTSNDAEGAVWAGGVSQANPSSASNAAAKNTVIRLGLAFKANDFYGALNGAGLANGNPDAAGALPSGIDRLLIGQTGAGSGRQGFWLRRLAYIRARILNTQLQALTANWSTLVDAALLYDSGTVNAGADARYKGLCCRLMANAVTARYLRLDIADATLANLDLGLLMAGPVFQPTRNFAYGWGHGARNRGRRAESKGGQLHVGRRARQRILNLEFNAASEAEVYAECLEMERLCGDGGNVLVIPKPGGANEAAQRLIGTLEDNGSVTQARFNLWQYRFSLVERL